MDIVTTFIVIIVTALTNALVIGALGSYFKRGIERSFDEKLEAYKAYLQKDLSEHQTRFVRNHEKAAETLEKLFRDYADYAKEFSHILLVLEMRCDPADWLKEKHEKETVEERIAVSEKLSDRQHKCWKKSMEMHEYFRNNQHYLSDDVKNTISNALDTASLYNELIHHPKMIILGDFDSASVEEANFIIKLKNEFFHLNIPVLDENPVTMKAFIDQIYHHLDDGARALENLYKAEADIGK